MKTIIQPNDHEAVLAAFKGSYAQIWLFNVSLKRLVIRLSWHYSMEEEREQREVVYILGAGCEHICGSFSWDNADISIKYEDAVDPFDQRHKISDKGSGFELITSGGIAMSTGPSHEIDTSFENFLGERSTGT